MAFVQVSITLGDGKEFGVDENNDLILVENAGQIYRQTNLGHFTHQRLDQLKDYLERLRPHAR